MNTNSQLLGDVPKQSDTFELGAPNRDADPLDESVSLELQLVDERGALGSLTRPIVIAVPTFRRPKSLTTTLKSLADLETELCFTILVADNDSDQSEGLAVVEQLKLEGYRWAIEAISVPDRGISQVRNAIIRHAFARSNGDSKLDSRTAALVMLDDDQWVDTDWLDQLVLMQEKTAADVVGNRVVADFRGKVPEWAEGQYVFGLSNKPGGLCYVVDGTGGVLLTRRVLGYANGKLFDLDFSSSGGGDSEFFARIKTQGAKFAYADRAIAHEVIDSSRTNKRWARRRAFRIGDGYMRIAKRHEGGWQNITWEYLKAVAAIIAALVLMLLHTFNSRKRMTDSLLLFRNLGKLSSLVAVRIHEYKTTVGS